jgi:AraC-like DNA-binding protein/mannose-6-phosphate isomerase-like protein (cupin superfamily)
MKKEIKRRQIITDDDGSQNDWTITINIGPIVINIFLESAFFDFSKEQNTEKHRHSIFELHIVAQGTGVLHIEDSQYKIVPDSFYIINKGVYHSTDGANSNPLKKYCFRFEYNIIGNGDTTYRDDEIKKFIYTLSNITFFYSNNLNIIKSFIYEIKLELQQKPLGYYTKVRYLFSLFYITVLREVALKATVDYVVPSSGIKYESRIKIIENFFDTAYHNKVTIQDLCKLTNISSSQLNRIIKNKYNMSFKQKLIENRMEYVKYLLLNTNLPIKVISEKVGYNSENNFSTFFKLKFGASPKRFKNNN